MGQPVRHCRFCGRPLAARLADARYCGEPCRRRARRVRAALKASGGLVGARTHLGRLAAAPVSC